MILRATELLEPGHTSNRATTIALTLYVSYNVAATVTSSVAGRSSDRSGAPRVLAVGVAAFGIAYLGFTRDTSMWQALLPWFVLAGIGIGCVETAEHAAVATHAPELSPGGNRAMVDGWRLSRPNRASLGRGGVGSARERHRSRCC